MKLENSPCTATYVLQHYSGRGFIKRANMPPRTCEWTTLVSQAEVFELENEAKYCAEFITKYAFNVVVVDISGETNE